MASILSGLFRSPKQKANQQENATELRIDTDAQPDDEDVIMENDYEALAQAEREAADLAYEAALEHEIVKRAAAPKRWNGNIAPTDEAFQMALDGFIQQLADQNKSINSIIKECFTSHEESLLIPANKRTNPSLAKLQAANRKRYQALLTSPRFQDWSGRENLAFKFTLVHFGLPVPPITADFEQKLELHIEDSDEEDIVDYDPLGGHLRFLNGYSKRLFSNDSGRVPDPTLEAYYGLDALEALKRGRRPDRKRNRTLAMNLRGGGSFENDDMDVDSRSSSSKKGYLDTEVSMALTSLSSRRMPASATCAERPSLRGGDGGSIQSTYPGILGLVDDAVFGGKFGPWEDIALKSMLQRRADEDLLASEVWLPLYGTQGIVWFELNSLETFVDAVDRLLGLDTRAGLSYTLSIYDRNTDYSDDLAQQHWEMSDVSYKVILAGEGDFDFDNEALIWLRKVLPKNPVSMKNWAIYVSAFNDAYPSWAWDPTLANEEVMCFTMMWEDGTEARPDVAYLKLPKNYKGIISSNVYGPWMAHITRVLTPGHLPGRPGKPAIPDAFFNLHDTSDPEVSTFYTYGGLHFPDDAWCDIKSQFEFDDTTVRQLVGRHGADPGSALKPSTCLKIFMPGYNENFKTLSPMIDHGALGNPQLVWKTITDMVRQSLAEASYNAVQTIEIWIPGDSFFMESQSTRQTVPIAAGDELDQSDEVVAARAALLSLSQRLAQWRDWLIQKNRLDSFPQFITIRPVFEQYTISDEDRPSKDGILTPFDLETTSLAQFRGLVKSVWETKKRPVEYKEDQAVISIKQPIPYHPILPVVSVVERLSRVYDYKPLLLITPETTEHEWNLLRKLVISPNLSVTVVESAKVVPSFVDTQTFGFNDLYEYEDEDLYADSGGVRPVPAQYFDWQLWEKNALPNRITLQPKIYTPVTLDLDPPPAQDQTSQQVTERSGTETNPAKRRTRVSFDLATEAPGESSRARQTTLTTTPAQTQIKSNPKREHYKSDQELAQAVRRYAFDNRLSIQDYRTIPINAPPLEQVLDLRNSNVPVVSLAVLTPTEVRRLQINHYDMRNLALDRIQKCPYSNCNETFSMLVPGNLQNHLALQHAPEKCNFCDEFLYQHWTVEQRFEHFIAKHRNILTFYQDRGHSTAGDATIKSGADPGTEANSDFFSKRESRWHFCSRCGRDHHVLNLRPDRIHHDAICRPGKGIELNSQNTWKVCSDCGWRVDPSVTARGVQHAHRDDVPENEAPYCEQCGLALGSFEPSYRERHTLFCRGKGVSLVSFCPWCNVHLPLNLQTQIRHLSGCDKLPGRHALGPIDLQSGQVIVEYGQEYSRAAEAPVDRSNPIIKQEDQTSTVSSQKNSRLSTFLPQKFKDLMSGKPTVRPKSNRSTPLSRPSGAKAAPAPKVAQTSTRTTKTNTPSKKRKQIDNSYQPSSDDSDSSTDQDDIEAVKAAQNFTTDDEARQFLASKRRRVGDPSFRPTLGENPEDLAAEPTPAAVSKDAESLLPAGSSTSKGNGSTTSLFRKGFESNLTDLKAQADKLSQTKAAVTKRQTSTRTKKPPAKTP